MENYESNFLLDSFKQLIIHDAGNLEVKGMTKNATVLVHMPTLVAFSIFREDENYEISVLHMGTTFPVGEITPDDDLYGHIALFFELRKMDVFLDAQFDLAEYLEGVDIPEKAC